ncbi:MAG: hypothetical protein OYM47_00480 [Gemmatimonadota bacterium]|nr:hypothetical protein [Gemmatimonadota bacterium]
MDQKYQKWRKWIKAIYKELQGVLIQRHIFWEVQKIIKSNPKIQIPSAFYGFLGNAYSSLGVTAIRRLTKSQRDSVSLTGLLKEVQESPEIMSEERYAALFSTDGPGPLKGEFEGICEGIVDNHIDPAVVKTELCRLSAKKANLEDFVDKKVAHLDKKELTGGVSAPTFNELDGCLDYLETLVKKYYLLLTAESVSDMMPTFQYDWKEIFYEPWIYRS